MRNQATKGGSMRAFSCASLAIVAMLAFGTIGCAKINQVRANGAFKEANNAYQQQDYKKAIDSYEAVLRANPDMNVAYFYLGNSYDNLYKPKNKGEASNEELLQKAVKNYQIAAERLATSDKPQDKKL